MPYYKSQFAPTSSIELEFMSRAGHPKGRLKIKQSTLLWKPADGKKYRSISLDRFSSWIMSRASRSRAVRF